jgi:hypothetical protein
MKKFVGDVFDDIGCFFARCSFDYVGAFFAKCAEAIDAVRVEE